MKILFFHRWVGVHGGGTETHLLELAKRFSILGHDITILTRSGNRLNDIDQRIRVRRISKNFQESQHSYEDARVYIHTTLFILKSFLKLIVLKLKGESFDLVSVHFASEAIVARLYRFFTGTPFIFVLEGYTPLEAMTAQYANLRIAISNFEAGVYKDKHGLSSKVIYIGVDSARFSVEENLAKGYREKFAKDKQILILTVCRLEPRKDIPTLIEAAKVVNKINPEIKFLITGDGISKQEIEKIITGEKLHSFIHLAGFISDKDLPYIYGASDIFVLTSKEEWFGIVFLEAMAAGLPIIATDVDACPEVVNGCGLFFKSGDFQGLAENILKLANDPVLRKELSLKAKNRAKEFIWEKQILVYEQAYKSVLEGKDV